MQKLLPPGWVSFPAFRGFHWLPLLAVLCAGPAVGDDPFALFRAPAGKSSLSGGTLASVEATEQLAFLGETYNRKFITNEEGVRIYQFFKEDEWAWSWHERMELRIHPADGSSPIERATAEAKAAQEANPKAKQVLYKEPSGKMAMLDYVTWSDQAPNTVTLHVIRYTWDEAERGIISVHYLRRVSTRERGHAEVADEVNDVRKVAIEALAAMPRYRQ